MDRDTAQQPGPWPTAKGRDRFTKWVTRVVMAMVVITLVGIGALYQAAIVMVGAHVANGYWPNIPALSYSDAFWLTWAWGVIWLTFNRNVQIGDINT